MSPRQWVSIKEEEVHSGTPFTQAAGEGPSQRPATTFHCIWDIMLVGNYKAIS